MNSDIFMSSSYDAMQCQGTLETKQNISNTITENIDISLFEELKNVTYEEHLDPFVGQSEINSSIPEISYGIKIQNNVNSTNLNKRYILDEVTGQLIEDMDIFEENLNNDDYYLNEKTASLQKALDIVKTRNEVLESALKTSFSSFTKHSEKQLLKKVVYNSKNKQYTSKVLGLKVTARLKPNKAKKIEIPEIKAFFVRDDVSRITSGKKECRVKNKNKRQIRYLVDSISNLHKKYRAQGGHYGITTFYKNKPFFVLSPHIQSRSTCLCEKHDNIKFQYESLRRHRIINDDFDKLLQDLVCDTKNLECMYNKCKKCKNKTPKFPEDQDISHTVNWKQWERQDHAYTKKGGTTVHTKKTVRVTKTDTAQKLIDDFTHDIIAFKRHHYNNIHQQNEYRKLVNNLKATEAVIICDFSENYQSKLTEEIQSMHFDASKSQIILHTGMIYLKNSSQSFCTISDNLTHQPPAIWAHLTPILDTVKDMCPNVDVIHYYSDGPTSQYRQKVNFFLHYLFTRQLNLSYSTWSFFEAGHGKSVADGIGGTIKRMLDKKVCHGADIKNARDAYEAIKQSDTMIQVHLIEEDAINTITNAIPDNVRVLPGTMKVHQIITDTQTDGYKINYRDVSCFCDPLRGKCSCFSLGEHCLLSYNGDPIQPLPSSAVEDEADLLHDLVELQLPSPAPSCSIIYKFIFKAILVHAKPRKGVIMNIFYYATNPEIEKKNLFHTFVHISVVEM
ncbi:unnamed protein product, partial [Brenthis ino]